VVAMSGWLDFADDALDHVRSRAELRQFVIEHGFRDCRGLHCDEHGRDRVQVLGETGKQVFAHMSIDTVRRIAADHALSQAERNKLDSHRHKAVVGERRR
jgi:hypothetical protein